MKKLLSDNMNFLLFCVRFMVFINFLNLCSSNTNTNNWNNLRSSWNIVRSRSRIDDGITPHATTTATIVNDSLMSYYRESLVDLNAFKNNDVDEPRSTSLIRDILDDVGEPRRKHRKKRKYYQRFILPLLLAYKLKFFTLIPVMIGGLVLLAGSTGLAGFFFALFAAVMGLKSTGSGSTHYH